jgi:hypothetical protein
MDLREGTEMVGMGMLLCLLSPTPALLKSFGRPQWKLYQDLFDPDNDPECRDLSLPRPHARNP